MQIGCDYVLQINTVGHMTFFTQSKGGPFVFKETP